MTSMYDAHARHACATYMYPMNSKNIQIEFIACITNICGWSLYEVICGFCATDYAVISEHARHTCAKYVYTIVQV